MTDNLKPRYVGFNILDLFSTSNRWDEHFPMTHGDFVEDDFKWMHEWGFNFARIPMSYLYFISDGSRKSIDTKRLSQLDKLVEYGEKYSIHISLSYHRAPGYCVTGYPYDISETGNIWNNSEDREVFYSHWETFAKHFYGISSDRLSFDLLNEPPFLYDEKVWPQNLTKIIMESTGGLPAIDFIPTITKKEKYLEVHKTAVDRIHAIDPDRVVVIEGSNMAHWPAWELKDIPNTFQSMRGYLPTNITHYGCPWGDPEKELPYPEWPYTAPYLGLDHWDMDVLKDIYSPWIKFKQDGYMVHMGELGCCAQVPHDVVLAWFEDMLRFLKENDIGYSLWNFRGPFGILDSGRDDIEYENWFGHKLDRKLLEMLQKYN